MDVSPRAALAAALAFWSTLFLGAGCDPARAGVPIGGEFMVNTYTEDDQKEPLVASDPDGDFVVVWEDDLHDGDYAGVFARRFGSDGSAIGAQFQINTFTTSSQHQAALAGQSDGDFIVAWASYGQDGSNRGVFAQRFTSSGAPDGIEFQVDTNTVSAQNRPAVATSDGSGFVVAWQASPADGSSYGVFARRFAADGSPIADPVLVNTYTTANQALPSVAMLPTGEFLVTWESNGQDGDAAGVFAQRFSSTGLAIGTELQINEATSGSQANADVGFDGAGNALIAWDSSHSGNRDVFARRLSSTGALIGSEFRVNTFFTANQSEPDLLVRPAGDFLVSWHSQDQDGSLYGAFAQRFSPTGITIGPEFRINVVVFHPQVDPAAAFETNGDFVVVWASVSQDGTLNQQGIFGRRFKGQLADADGNGQVEPLTDGVLILRHLSGFSGSALSSGAVDEAGCTRCDATAIDAYLESLGLLLDVDGSGVVEPLRDSILILRWLFGFTDQTLVEGAVDEEQCSRCEADALSDYLGTLGP